MRLFSSIDKNLLPYCDVKIVVLRSRRRFQRSKKTSHRKLSNKCWSLQCSICLLRNEVLLREFPCCATASLHLRDIGFTARKRSDDFRRDTVTKVGLLKSRFREFVFFIPCKIYPNVVIGFLSYYRFSLIIFTKLQLFYLSYDTKDLFKTEYLIPMHNIAMGHFL